MTQASCKTTINISADAIGQVIGEFGPAEQYLIGVVTCTVEGAGVGALRTLTSADGGLVVVRLDARDGYTLSQLPDHYGRT